MADAPQAQAFTADGTAKGEVALDAEVFGIEPNSAVMHQVVTAQLAAARSGSANTKTRAEVRGGGRKPWRQKGLGRARHGSRRSPIWVGGGVAHGPKPRSYAERTPKKMKRLALRSALSARASEGSVLVVESPEWGEPRTKRARRLLETIGVEGKTLIVVPATSENVIKSFRNLPSIRLVAPNGLTTYDVLWARNILFTGDTAERAGGRSGYDVSEDDFVKEVEVDS